MPSDEEVEQVPRTTRGRVAAKPVQTKMTVEQAFPPKKGKKRNVVEDSSNSEEESEDETEVNSGESEEEKQNTKPGKNSPQINPIIYLTFTII